jgi:hypothetical protein
MAAYEFVVSPLLDNPQRVASGSNRHWLIDTAPGAAPIASSTASTTSNALSQSWQ